MLAIIGIARLGRGGSGADYLDANGNHVYLQPRVITVGGTMAGADGQGVIASSSTRDYRWQKYIRGVEASGVDSGSNWGVCVSISAPSHKILSLHIDGTERVSGASGTSFAAPQVAGAVARYLQGRVGDPANWSSSMPEQAWNWLSSNAVVSDQTAPHRWATRRVVHNGFFISLKLATAE